MPFKSYFTSASLMLGALAAGGHGACAAPRTFVSGKGADSGSCTVTQPCRSFAYAIGQTDSAGEIAVLDTAGYGPVTITKSVSIINQEGVEAGVTVSGSTAGVAVQNGTVTLRGLSISGANSGAIGISLTGGNVTLRVDHCTITGMTQAGISVTPASGGNVIVTDTTLANNAGDGILLTASSSGQLYATISRSKIVQNGFDNSGNGIHMKGPATSYGFAFIDNSLISQNGTGLYLESNGANAVSLLSNQNNIVGNYQSMYIGAQSSVRLEKTVVYAPFGGIVNNGAIYSFGDNVISDAVSGNALQTNSLK